MVTRPALVLVVAFSMLLALACDRKRGPRAPKPNPNPYAGPAGYDAAGNPLYGPGYPQQPGGYGYPQSGNEPVGPDTSIGAAEPSKASGFAIDCTSDATCGTHRCNTAGRCAYPCQNAGADCATGLVCEDGFCGPNRGP